MLEPAVSILLTILPILLVFPVLFALTTVLERKGLGRIQNRFGPNRVGFYGILQPMADALKSLTKEDIVPASADHTVHFLAPLVLLAVAFVPYAVLPIGRNMIAANLDAGVLFFFAIGAISELSVFMAGWSSRNKYSLLGAMRAVAQMISYEVPLLLSSVAVIMAAGSLSTVEIVQRQAGFSGIFPHWYVLTPWGFAGFVLFMIAATAETNRSPFDLPEGSRRLLPGITSNIPALSSPCSSWENIWGCLPLADWGSPCFWADGRRRCRFSPGFLPGFGFLPSCWGSSLDLFGSAAPCPACAWIS